MPSVDAKFILHIAFYAAVGDSEASLTIWAERHGIDPQEMIRALKLLVEAQYESGVSEEAKAAYFLQLGYEIRRRQQEETEALADA